jgi:formate hydrogenlyase transcriptional activator
LSRNIAWNLRGTPCADVVFGPLCYHPTGVSQKFPQDGPLVQMGIDSDLGVPLRDSDTLGRLAVFDEHPLPPAPRWPAAGERPAGLTALTGGAMLP